jgi:histidine triad (HIT) family protein
MSESCLFCRIARGDLPVPLVAETGGSVAFRDINPQAPLHVLVIPRAHVASLDAAQDAAQMGELLLLAAEVARREGYAESGYRTVINTGRDAGQTVFHVHLHLLAGRPLTWPPG